MKITEHVKVFSTLFEFVDEARKHTGLMNDMWGGGLSMSAACDATLRGEPESSHKYKTAKEIIDKVDAAVHDRLRDDWVPSVAGAYPIVPDYLMGQVECMRARKPVESDIAPIKLVIELGYAAAATDDQVTRYGAALTALAMCMVEVRPVEFWVFDFSRFHYTDVLAAFKMDSTPISMAHCVVVTAQQYFARQMCLSYEHHIAKNYSSTAAFGGGAPSAARANKIRELLTLEDKDVLIQAGLVPDANLMRVDPVKWVHAQLEKQRHLEQ